MGKIVRKLTSKELKELDPKQFAFKLTIQLGPAFAKGKLSFTNKELAEALDEAAKCRKKSPLSAIFIHLAEHIRFEAAHRNDNGRFLSSSAPTTLDAVYYGCGSCGEGYCICNDSCEECC